MSSTVHPSPPPTEWDRRTQQLEEAPPKADDSGVYHQTWILRDATSEEIESWDLAHSYPNWKGFTDEVILDPVINSALSNLLESHPGAYGGIIVGLGQAANGSPDLFLSSFNKVIDLIDPVVVDTLCELSIKYNLGLKI